MGIPFASMMGAGFGGASKALLDYQAFKQAEEDRLIQQAMMGIHTSQPTSQVPIQVPQGVMQNPNPIQPAVTQPVGSILRPQELASNVAFGGYSPATDPSAASNPMSPPPPAVRAPDQEGFMKPTMLAARMVESSIARPSPTARPIGDTGKWYDPATSARAQEAQLEARTTLDNQKTMAGIHHGNNVSLMNAGAARADQLAREALARTNATGHSLAHRMNLPHNESDTDYSWVDPMMAQNNKTREMDIDQQQANAQRVAANASMVNAGNRGTGALTVEDQLKISAAKVGEVGKLMNTMAYFNWQKEGARKWASMTPEQQMASGFDNVDSFATKYATRQAQDVVEMSMGSTFSALQGLAGSQAPSTGAPPPTQTPPPAMSGGRSQGAGTPPPVVRPPAGGTPPPPAGKPLPKATDAQMAEVIAKVGTDPAAIQRELTRRKLR